MDRDAMQAALDDISDQALLSHGYVDYIRDYEVRILAVADPRTRVPTTDVRWLFRCCVQAEVISTLSGKGWRASLDDRLLDPTWDYPHDAYVWGARWQTLWGARIIADSPRAATWTEQVGFDIYEVRINGNGHDITLFFSDLEIEEVPRPVA
jgi:hypothetical protein